MDLAISPSPRLRGFYTLAASLCGTSALLPQDAIQRNAVPIGFTSGYGTGSRNGHL